MSRFKFTLFAKLAVLCGVGLLAQCLPGTAETAKPVAPIFTIHNNSGLSDKVAKFYYLGAGSNAKNNFIVLMPDGSWAEAGSAKTGWNDKGWNSATGSFDGSGIVPCYPLKGNETISLPLDAGSMRVYVFMVSSKSRNFKTPCMNTPAVSPNRSVRGIFGSAVIPGNRTFNFAPYYYNSLKGNGGVIGLDLSKMRAGYIPPWSYAEMSIADIDTSQVDAIAFPLNVTAKMDATPGITHPVWDQGVGFSFSAESIVNMQAVLTSYRDFVARLPKSGGTRKAPIAPQSSFSALRVSYANGSGQFLVNPGNYLGKINPGGRPFVNFFQSLVDNYMWQNWNQTIDVGSKIGKVPVTKFEGVTTTLKGYPGYSRKKPVPIKAIRFTGGGLTAYVLSPTTYQALCKANAIALGCGTPAYQIFATDGALNTPPDANQFGLLTPAEQKAWAPYGGRSAYDPVVARLGFIISMAFNHGVAGGLTSAGGLCSDKKKYPEISACWSDQRLWYPDPPSAAQSKLFFGADTTQNQFARWLHTAQIGTAPKLYPMMTRPNNPTRSPAGLMGMGYGFAADENPTPPFDAKTMSQTPSEYSGNVGMVKSRDCNFITIIPMAPGKSNFSPVVSACK